MAADVARVETDVLAAMTRGFTRRLRSIAALERPAMMSTLIEFEAEAVTVFQAVGREVITEVSRELIEFNVSPRMRDDVRAGVRGIRDNIEKDIRRLVSEARVDVRGLNDVKARARLDKLSRDLSTTVDTGVLGMDRAISVVQSEIAGVEYFLYDGPKDGRNRPFCAKLVGKRLTKKQLRNLRNDVGPQPPSIWAGGYGCRHRLVALDTDELSQYPAYRGK